MKHLCTLLLALAVSITASFSQEKEEAKAEHKKGEHGLALKELTAFHDILHPLVHEALPNSDFATIRKGIDELLEKAMVIQQAKLPKKLLGRSKEFKKKAAELAKELQEMSETKDKVDDATIEKQFNEMHDTFESLAEIIK
ncbi:MAG: hypothetical protein HW412_773 [Bacteroidetes bacterium]|nr:hypothetical protein [Bacteroidota bacterium]